MNIQVPAVQCTAVGFCSPEGTIRQQLLSWQGISLACSKSAQLLADSSEGQSDAPMLYAARLQAGKLEVGVLEALLSINAASLRRGQAYTVPSFWSESVLDKWKKEGKTNREVL